jgi:chlorophyll synthase
MVVREAARSAEEIQADGKVLLVMGMDFSLALYLATAVGIAVLAWVKPELLQTVSRGVRLLRSIHYLLMTFVGAYIGYAVMGRPLGMDFDPWKIVIAELSIFFVFQSSVILNDFYDLELDKASGKKTPLSTGAINPRLYMLFGVVYTALSLLFGLSLGYTTMLMVLSCHFLSWFYSAPPFRVKQIYPLSILLIAVAAVWAALVGMSIYAGGRIVMFAAARGSILGYVVFGLALNFKDFLDVQGDRQGEVRTIFTILGRERGRVVIAILMLAAYGLIPVILRFNWLFLVSIPCGLGSAYFCLRRPFKEYPIFFIYFVFLVLLGFAAVRRPEILKPF